MHLPITCDTHFLPAAENGGDGAVSGLYEAIGDPARVVQQLLPR